MKLVGLGNGNVTRTCRRGGRVGLSFAMSVASETRLDCSVGFIIGWNRGEKRIRGRGRTNLLGKDFIRGLLLGATWEGQEFDWAQLGT